MNQMYITEIGCKAGIRVSNFSLWWNNSLAMFRKQSIELLLKFQMQHFIWNAVT